MAELKTPNGLIVGLIPKKSAPVEEKTAVKPTVTETPHRGRKKSN